MRIYISGKITGLPIEEARKKFQEAEEFLKTKYNTFPVQIINPFNLDHSKAQEMESAPVGTYTAEEIWIQYMKEDVGAVLGSDGIYMLKNWEQSKGARIEFAIAKELGLTVEYEQ